MPWYGQRLLLLVKTKTGNGDELRNMYEYAADAK